LSFKVDLRAVDLIDERTVLHIGHTTCTMPSQEESYCVAWQQGGCLKCALSMKPSLVPWKNMFMQKYQSNKCPRVTI